MIFKIVICCLLASLICADNSIDSTVSTAEPTVPFETSHKRPGDAADGFETSHRISHYDVENMNLLPTKEKPELNPILSALINEDVMKSIEAKRAIEEAELEIIKSEIAAEEKRLEEEKKMETEPTTEVPLTVLTTAAPMKKPELDTDDEINVGFVDQAISLDTAGTENNKKSRIEIKKGPNGQDYEYEYVYYYEEDEDDAKTKTEEKDKEVEAESRGKSRYTNIDRSTTASPADNSLVSGKAKGRSSNVEENIETERLPQNTRFPSRGKNHDVAPTPALDSVDSAAEKKKISVKRPSLELVDSETFNTDEKQAKGSRNPENDTKTAIAIEQEMAAAQATKDAEDAEKKKAQDEDSAMDEDEDVEQTTPAMEKAAFDLYAILANENNNMEMTTDSDMDATTMVPDTTDMYGDDMLTTMIEEEPSSTSTTTTTTTTPEPTTTTTTTTTVAPLFGGKRGGLNSAGRNRFKLKSGTGGTSTTTELPASEAPKGKNRFSRPSIGGRPRLGAKTTAAPAPEENQEEEVSVKEVKPVSSGFARNRPRNRFNIRGSTTTENAAAKSEDGGEEETVSSTTARTLRGRPTLNLRGRSRTTKAPVAEEENANDSENSVDEKSATPAPAPTKASRFNLNRAGNNRLPARGKLGRTTEAPAAAEDDSAADSSHHNDVKGEGEESADKPADEKPSANLGGLNRLKNRPRIGGAQKTEKPKAAPAPAPPRKINPLLAKKRLQLGSSTTEAAPSEASSEESDTNEETAASTDDENKEEPADEAETTTKQQARGLGLLGQRRPLRKPGTLL